MEKKCLAKLITVILIISLSLSVGGVALSAPSGIQAVLNKSTVRINNAEVDFEAYTIGGNNYFRLRDLAMAFIGSAKRFSVEWDGTTNVIRLMSDQLYNPIGGELKTTNNPKTVTANPTTSTVYFDGKQISAKAYVIGGTNYFKLRDIGVAMNFSVTYDSTATSIRIDTTKEYYMPALLELLPGATYKEYYTPDQLALMPSGTVAEGFVFYNQANSGSISITERSKSYFTIVCDNVPSDNDLTKLKSVLGVFVSEPSQVMTAVINSKKDGQKILMVESKSFTCTYIGQSITINVSW